MKPTRRQRRFMAAMMPDGTVATGSDTGRELAYAGLIKEVRYGRYGLTDLGRDLMRDTAEAGWNIASDTTFKRKASTWRR